MSFILEALKKVERERAAGLPKLDALERVRTPRRSVWPWVLSMALVVNAAVVWTVWQSAPPLAVSGDSPRAKPSVPTAAPSQESPGKTAAAGTLEGRQEPDPASPARRNHVASPVAPRKTREEGPKAPPEMPPDGVAAAASQSPALASPIGSLRADYRPAVRPQEVLPLWIQMPADLRATVPDLAINLMAYARDRSERLVYINNRRYTEGELVEGKLRIDAITREGVVLSYQGRRFLLPR